MPMTDGGHHQVAVVGLGAVTAAGVGVDALWSLCRSGRSAVVPHNVDDDRGPVKIAAVVPEDFEPKAFLSHPEARRAPRVAHLGFGAAAEAVAHAGWSEAELVRGTAVQVGSGLGGLLAEIETHLHTLETKGYMRSDPLVVPRFMPNALGALISLKYGITGPAHTTSLACASGTVAIGDAMRLIRWGVSERVLAGGAESLTDALPIGAFARLGALSTRNDEPERASRPFDAERAGFVMGEGGGFLALERLDLAQARGAEILALVSGYGATSDAFHLVAPAEDGAGAAQAMAEALADAAVEGPDIGHVNAHGTSTELNDRSEARAMHSVFASGVPPIHATKGAIGHLLGGAGAVEAVIAALSVSTGIVPPTANYENPDAELNLDVVAGVERHIGPAPVVSNSFAFGGHNASIVLTPAN